MPPGDEERPERPEYNVYRGGRSSRRDRGKGQRPPSGKSSGGGKPPEGDEPSAVPKGPSASGGDGDPAYRVYRSSRNPLARLRGGGSAVRDRFSRGGGDGGGRPIRDREPGEKPTWRKVAKWALIAAGCWFLLSVVLFTVSSEIQKSKLNGDAEDLLGGFPLLVASPQTILVMGTDVRPAGSPDENGDPIAEKCVDAAKEGDPHPDSCFGTRADTLMLIRAGGGHFEKLSIPRDTYAAIPGQDNQKINGAYSFGGAPLQIKTIEDFLGIKIDHAVILDFDGFAKFIDSIGGVSITPRQKIRCKVDGGSGNGGITLNLDLNQTETLDGVHALAYSRIRNEALPDGSSPCKTDVGDDTARAQRQQQVLSAIQSRLTSPWRLPINFARGPFIAWNAPKAMVTDMGALTLPQLGIAAAIGGNAATKILKPDGPGPGGSLFVPQQNCEKAVRQLLGEAGPETPACSPQ